MNQDEDEEKSQQVSVMSEVYSQATRVLICFGPDRTPLGCAQQAQSLLSYINEMFERILKNISGDWDSFPYANDSDPLLNDSRWPSWDFLVAQPWFERGWVVQEAGFAEDALLLWGRARIRWLWILRTIHWRVRRVDSRSALPESVDLYMHIYEIRYKAEAMSMWIEGDFGIYDVLGVLNQGRRLDVTDNRDRIYAFLGLPGAKAADIQDSLSIDYEKTWETVFQDFACCYVDRTNDLNLLHFIQHTEATILANAQYPSWIPQWQHKLDDDPLYRM